MAAVVEDVVAERCRQMLEEQYDDAHDDQHMYGELARAAAAYASNTEHREQIDVFATSACGGQSRVGWFLPHHVLWPWARDQWKPAGRRRDLIKAAALILAEIERLDRMQVSS